MSADQRSTTSTAPPIPETTEGKPYRQPIDVRQLPWMRKLAGDYAFSFGKVAPLYAGDPASGADWRDAIRRARAYPRRHGDIAAIVAAQQQRRGAPAEARAAAARLASPDTVAIVTGQQATVFGGPLYTLLKAITAIRLARRVARESQADAVAVFWVHAEDHDWEEVASCTVLDGAFQPRTVTLSALPGAGEKPLFELVLDGTIEQSLASLTESLPATEFREWLMTSLGSAYTPGRSLAEAFARWIEGLLGPHGLIVFESHDPAAKQLVSDIFLREIATAGRTAALATAAGEEMRTRGHQPQVVPHSDSVSLFHLDGARLPIKRQSDRFAIGESTVTRDELAREAESHPERFSPNVLLRAVTQDRLFPTIAYVPGPSELAYLAQLRGVYEHFGVPMPLLYPRATITLIDSAAARFLQRYDVPLEELHRQDESALNRLLESLLPASIESAMREAQEGLQRTMARVMEAMPALDPTLTGAAKTTRGKMEHDLRALHSKVIHAAKRRDETLRRQFWRAQAQMFPSGAPQERTLGVAFFLNRYGPALADRLVDDLPLDLGYHWILTI